VKTTLVATMGMGIMALRMDLTAGLMMMMMKCAKFGEKK
jgi:hypothetical protein